MDKKQYFNSITSQVFELREIARIQADKCFARKKMEGMLNSETAAQISESSLLAAEIPILRRGLCGWH